MTPLPDGPLFVIIGAGEQRYDSFRCKHRKRNSQLAL